MCAIGPERCQRDSLPYRRNSHEEVSSQAPILVNRMRGDGCERPLRLRAFVDDVVSALGRRKCDGKPS
jgi:hypothetical protein